MKIIISTINSNSSEPLEWIDLSYDNWDDFGFKTTFKAHYKNKLGSYIYLGAVQIGYSGMEPGKVSDAFDNEWRSFPDNFFSLGTSEEYYINVYSLGEKLSQNIFNLTNDVAYDLSLLEKHKDEDVLKTSLLRSRSLFSVKEQLHRIANGGAKLTPYNFKFNPHDKDASSSLNLEFKIVPDSNPPTNIHVLIGRNGTGKTVLIKNMIKSLISEEEGFGTFYDQDQGHHTSPFEDESFFCFANVLCVAFSPFDDFSILTEISDNKLPFAYIGLNKQQPDLLENICVQFISSFSECMGSTTKASRWAKSIEFLKSDPTFNDSQVYSFLNEWNYDKSANKQNAKHFLRSNFNSLSSGHKVVLLIITSCVEKLEEKSIIFLDEPENHLHPPLLSALMRSLSYLLINRNSVAIISTHSPVVLQEIPKSCVHKLYRNGNEIFSNRVEIETFGATIGSLTREIFGLEVSNSGFNKVLSDEVDSGYSYNRIIEKYNNELGEEAKALLQTLLILREHNDETNR